MPLCDLMLMSTNKNKCLNRNSDNCGSHGHSSSSVLSRPESLLRISKLSCDLAGSYSFLTPGGNNNSLFKFKVVFPLYDGVAGMSLGQGKDIIINQPTLLWAQASWCCICLYCFLWYIKGAMHSKSNVHT